jgi:hypothetical protein
MGYKIVYGQEFQHYAPPPSGSARIRILTAGFLLAGCILARCLWPEGASILRNLLLPGSPTATEQAFLTMMEDLRIGQSLGASITAFCKTVLENGAPLLS